jgi:hypothetical protein
VLFFGNVSRLFFKTLENKEYDDGTLRKMCGRIFRDIMGERSNVKMGKSRTTKWN